MSDFEDSKLAQSNVHALLYYGSPGSPARARALQLAKLWLCKSPGDGAPCGDCAPCRTMIEERAVDFHVVMPSGASSWIKIEQIFPGKTSTDAYPISSFIETGPILSPHKVILIEQCERLLPASSNGLLKMIEEPNPRVRFILTSESIGQVVPTIVSRCLCIACALPPIESLGELSALEQLFGEGSAVYLQRIREEPVAYKKLFDLLESLPTRHSMEALRAADDFRGVADDFSEKIWGGKRAIHSEMVRCLGLWARSQTQLHGAGVREAVEVHRRVMGNGSFALQSDWFFCEIFRYLHHRELAAHGL